MYLDVQVCLEFGTCGGAGGVPKEGARVPFGPEVSILSAAARAVAREPAHLDDTPSYGHVAVTMSRTAAHCPVLLY